MDYMNAGERKSGAGLFRRRRGLTSSVSLLLIIFSLTLVSTIAYNYALAQIGSRKEDLKLVASEEKMLDLEEAISSVAWSPGASRAIAFSDYGGQFRVEPGESPLQINVTLGATTGTVFDSDAGRFLSPTAGTLVVVEVGDQVVDAISAPDQTVDLGRVTDKGRTGDSSRAGLIADDTIHLLTVQELAGLVPQSLSHRFVDRHSTSHNM